MEESVKAYAKINIGLHVVKKTKKNYHKLDMIMCPIDLCDDLYFSESDDVVVEMDESICETKKNLCYKIARYLKGVYNVDKGIKIKIEKNIPSGAGLGGGSADGAAVLKFLNKYWNLKLSNKKLKKIGVRFGCDIPFFIDNKISRVSGLGEKVKKLKIKEFDKPIILIVPPFKMETKEVYQNFDEYRENWIPNTIENLKNGIIEPFNDLEATVNKLTNNKIESIINTINKKIDIKFAMTGSGSVIVGYLDNELTAEELIDVQNSLSDCKIILSSLKMYTY